MIEKELIFIDKDLKSKDEVFKFVSDEAFKLGLIKSKSDFIDKLYYREELMSTSLDFNLAIPHAKSSTIVHDFISYIKLSNDIMWNETDDDFTNQVILIAVSEGGSNRHLKYIAEISKKIIDDDFRMKLKNSKSVEEIYELLKDQEEKWK